MACSGLSFNDESTERERAVVVDLSDFLSRRRFLEKTSSIGFVFGNEIEAESHAF